MNNILTVADIKASVDKYGADNVLVYKLDKISGKHSLNDKGKAYKRQCTWIPLFFKKVDGKEVRLSFKTNEVYLPQGASTTKQEKLIEYNRRMPVKVQFRATAREAINTLENFIKPDSDKEYEQEFFDDLSEKVFRNNQELLEVMDALDASIRKQIQEIGRLDPRTVGFKMTNSVNEIRTIKLTEYEDTFTFEKKVCDPPLYRTYIDTEKDMSKPGVIGVRSWSKNPVIKPCIFDASKVSKKTGGPVEAFVLEDGVRTPLNYDNVSKFLNPGTLAVILFELDAVCIHPKGVKIELMVKDMKARRNLYNFQSSSPKLSNKDLLNFSKFMDEVDSDDETPKASPSASKSPVEDDLSDLDSVSDDGRIRDIDI